MKIVSNKILDEIRDQVRRELKRLRDVGISDEEIATLNSRIIYFTGEQLLNIEKEKESADLINQNIKYLLEQIADPDNWEYHQIFGPKGNYMISEWQGYSKIQAMAEDYLEELEDE